MEVVKEHNRMDPDPDSFLLMLTTKPVQSPKRSTRGIEVNTANFGSSLILLFLLKM